MSHDIEECAEEGDAGLWTRTITWGLLGIDPLLQEQETHLQHEIPGG